MKTPKDFAPQGSVGISALPKSVLNDMIDPQTGLANETGFFSFDDDPKSISDPIAAIIDFKLRLEEDEETKAIWRVCICEIYLSGLISGENKITKKKYINDDLCNILKEQFLINSSATGFDDSNDKELCFYAKKNTPFACLIPNIVLMPLKNLDTSVFEKSRWLDDETKKFSCDKIYAFFNEAGNNKQLPTDFYYYLRRLHAVASISAKPYISAFYEDILDNCFTPAEKPGVVNGYVSDPAITKVTDALEDGIGKRYTEYSDADIFNEKLLVFKHYIDGDEIENTNISDSGSAWDKYKICHRDILTPVKVKGLYGVDNYIYVIPPFKKKFIKKVINGSFKSVSWSAKAYESIYGEDGICTALIVSCKIKFENGIEITREAIVESHNIYLAEGLPYISMYPFVKPEIPGLWNEFFVACAHSKTKFDTSFLEPEFDSLTRNLSEVEAGNISVSVIEGVSELFTFTTDPFGRNAKNLGIENFKVLRTNIFPEFIGISAKVHGKSYDFGYWQLDSANATVIKSPAGITTPCVITYDFATTATVETVTIDGHDPDFINKPGTYLYDIFNPMFSLKESPYKTTWEQLQNYYLFGCETGELQKIYTYGQKNIAHFVDANGVTTLRNSLDNYITGRAALIDSAYLQKTIDGGFANSSVKSRLKWPQDSTANNLSEYTNHFILNTLSWALLHARIKGCTDISINMSHPMDQNTAAVKQAMTSIIQPLSRLSCYTLTNTNVNYFPEAYANAMYLTASNRLWHNIALNPQNGFIIIDLGGGTSDICVCKYDNIDVPFENRILDHMSFRYAGREIVDISLIRISDYSSLWKADSPRTENALKNFKYINKTDDTDNANDTNNIVVPENHNIDKQEPFIASVGYLIDHTSLNDDTYNYGNIGSRFNDMKFKFLAFFYTMGVYARKLADKELLSINHGSNFTLYITGGASKAIKSLCMFNDCAFIARCNYAATIGYLGEIPDDSESNGITNDYFNIEIITTGQKREVAYGLSLLTNEIIPNAPVGVTTNNGNANNGVANGGPNHMLAPAAISSDERRKNCFEKLVNAIAHVSSMKHNGSELTYDSNSLHVNTALCMTDYDGILSDHKTTINNWITNPNLGANILSYIKNDHITDELFAMYILEKYLDQLDKNDPSNLFPNC